MEEIKKQLDSMLVRLAEVQNKLDPATRTRQIQELHEKSSSPGFWDDTQAAQNSMKRLADLEAEEKEITDLKKDLEDAVSVLEILEDKDVKKLEKRLSKLEIKTFLNGPY